MTRALLEEGAQVRWDCFCGHRIVAEFSFFYCMFLLYYLHSVNQPEVGTKWR
jgi:hypothetical protein